MIKKLLTVLGEAGFTLPYTVDFSSLADGALPASFNAATWAIISGKAVNAPTEGAELLTDPGIEAWTSPTNATNYSEFTSGTSKVNQDTVEQHGGLSCARLDIDASNSTAIIYQAPAVSLGDWLVLRGWAKASATGKTNLTKLEGQYPESVARATTLTYDAIIHTGVIRIAGFQARFSNNSAASISLYYDDLSLKKLTLATLYAGIDAGVADVTVKANWTVPTLGVVSGVLMNLDSLTNPQNWVLLYIIGAGQFMDLLKCVNGTVSRVALLNTIVYAADAPVELRKTGTTYKAFYNGAQVGTDQTISDASIISNTLHAPLATNSSSRLSFFSLAAA